jgi:hypothetical protein
MNILHVFGKRFSNGAKINTMNILDLSSSGFATKKDYELLEKFKKNNAKKSLKKRCNERDRYS